MRIAIQVATALVLVGLVGYFGDWVVWRAFRGGATGVVAVSREVVAPLKGGREEYYYDGTENERCSRSVLPQGGMRACWWVERHRMIYDR